VTLNCDIRDSYEGVEYVTLNCDIRDSYVGVEYVTLSHMRH